MKIGCSTTASGVAGTLTASGAPAIIIGVGAAVGFAVALIVGGGIYAYHLMNNNNQMHIEGQSRGIEPKARGNEPKRLAFYHYVISSLLTFVLCYGLCHVIFN